MHTRTQRALDEFLALTAVNGRTRRERAIADVLIGKLQDLGFTVHEDDAGEKIGGNAGNLTARLQGDPGKVPILLCAHMDRVAPGEDIHARVVDGIICSSGDTILAADDVAGLVSILEGVRRIREDGVDHPPIEVVFTVAEEGGLNGAKAYDASGLTAGFGFFFDSAADVGTVITQAPSQTSLRLIVGGQAAHAGIAPEKGISALQAAARGVSRMNLGRIDAETTANIGIFQSGSATNVVPDKAVLQGEVRSLSDDKRRQQTESMVAALQDACTHYGADLDVDAQRSYPGYRFDPGEPVVQRAAAAIADCGLAVQYASTGGGSDANIFNSFGIPSVVFGMGFKDVHSTAESLAAADLERTVRVAYALLYGTAV